MKKLVLFLFLSLMFRTAAHAQNLLTNPGFEADTVADGTFSQGALCQNSSQIRFSPGLEKCNIFCNGPAFLGLKNSTSNS